MFVIKNKNDLLSVLNEKLPDDDFVGTNVKIEYAVDQVYVTTIRDKATSKSKIKQIIITIDF